jgi:hypothetical protein
MTLFKRIGGHRLAIIRAKRSLGIAALDEPTEV